MDEKYGICVVCGNKFPKPVANKKYCSPACYRKAEAARKRLKRFNNYENELNPSPAAFSDEDMLAELSRRGYSIEIERLEQDQRHIIKIDRFRGDYLQVGCISCTHLGSRYQQLTALREFYKVCAERGISMVLHAGDAVDGDGTVYDGQIYEMFLQGADPQRDYMVEKYPHEEGITTKIIGGNHDNSFVKSSNTNVLEQVAKEREDIEYLGEYGAFLDFEIKGCPPIKFYIMHGGGKSQPYARSYRMQKIIESFTPENKPHILLLGHWHVACHLPQYRNVEGFLMGAFQAQTPHLKRLGIWPTTIALILRIYPDDRGIARIETEWLHWHLQREKDYP